MILQCENLCSIYYDYRSRTRNIFSGLTVDIINIYLQIMFWKHLFHQDIGTVSLITVEQPIKCDIMRISPAFTFTWKEMKNNKVLIYKKRKWWINICLNINWLTVTSIILAAVILIIQKNRFLSIATRNLHKGRTFIRNNFNCIVLNASCHGAIAQKEGLVLLV